MSVHKIQAALVKQWGEALKQFGKISPQFRALPEGGFEVFKPSNATPLAGATRFDIEPVALNLKERPTDTSAHLFVALKGFIYIDTEKYAADRKLVTRSFGTRAAYFRQTCSRSSRKSSVPREL
jgi:hypothetical protein